MSKRNKIAGQVLVELLAWGRRGYLGYRARTANSPFFRNKLIVWSLILNVLFLVLNFFYIFLKLRLKEGLIPLHYNIYFGVDLIGNKGQILKLPFVGLIVLGVNYFLARFVYGKERFVSYILVDAALAVAIILFLAGVFILNI